MSDLTIWCLAVDDAHPVGDVFDVNVALSNTISGLKIAILAAENGPTELKSWRAADLSLWKPTNNLADDVHLGEIVHTLRLDRRTRKEDNNKATFLGPSKKISKVFGEKLEEECVHVLVQLPASITQVSRPHRLSTVSPLDDEAIIQKHVEAAKGKKPPSIGATPSAYPTTQADSPILNGRPFATRTTPVHLYHDVFTTFTRLYSDNSQEIPPDIQAHIFSLCHASAELYETTKKGGRVTGETKRLKAIRPIYRMILNEPIGSTRADDSEADGTLTTVMNDGQLALRGILEDKNEIGAGGCDPNLRACLSYIKYWSMDELDATRKKCCCPSFVIR